MRRILRILALLIAISSLSLWLGTGANRGWTKTSVPVKTLDDVTGIEGITYRKQFVPGVDFLATAFSGAILLACGSLFFRNSKTKQTINK